MTTKEELEKELSQVLHGHPSRTLELRLKRCEEIIILLAEKIDKIYQEGFENGYDNGIEDAINK